MISLEKIIQFMDELGPKISDVARAQILHMSKSDPARTVGLHRGQSVFFRSKKMDATLQAESRSCEYAFLSTCEADPDALIILDQPCKMMLKRSAGLPPVPY